MVDQLPEYASRIRPRGPEPESRFNVYAAVLATTVAATSYLVFLSLRSLPPPGLAAMLFASAPLCGLIVLPLLVSRARVEKDAALAWFACGLGVAVLAMLLQLISLPAVFPDGGIFGTDNQGSAQLYLLFHLALIAGAAAAALKANPRHLWVLASVGTLVVLAATADLLPTPMLLTEDQEFTTFLSYVQFGVTAGLAAALLGWIRVSGVISSAIHGWIGVSLLLLTYETLLNGVSSRRFDAVWWSSLSMRSAALIVLLAGVSLAIAQRLRRFEGYSQGELSRREGELDNALTFTERLLGSAAELARGLTPRDVARALARTVTEVCEFSTVLVYDLRPDGSGLRCLVGDPGDQAKRAQALAETAFATGPLLRSGSESDVVDSHASRRVPGAIADVGSVASLPLRVGGRTIGALVGYDSRPLAWDRGLVLGIAAQAGPALSRARLYEREHRAAEALQHALLPERLPDVPSISLAGRYVAGQRGVRVGGDWYDCLDLGDGRVSLIVGDVMGKGVHAASLMGRLRDAARVLVSVDPQPSAVLEGLNEVLLGLETDRIATVAYVLVDATNLTATVGLAGHPPPVLLEPAGEGAALVGEASVSPLLGLPAVSRSQAQISVSPGAALVLYTDGLVESREGISDGLERVLAQAQSVMRENPSADVLADEILKIAPASSRNDDVAVLVARITERATPTLGE